MFGDGFFCFTIFPMLSFARSSYDDIRKADVTDITFEWLVFHINLSIL